MGKPWSGAFFLCSLSQFAVFFFIGRAVYQKQFCQSNVQNKQRGCETEYRHMRYNLAVMHASNVCARLYKQLCVSQFVFGCVSFFFYGFHSSIWASAGLATQQNETKQSRADLRYHPKAGHRSLSLRTVTCWSSYNYSSHPHPSQYCCGVRRAHSLSGSAALHKETITKSKQAPSTKRRGTTEGRT